MKRDPISFSATPLSLPAYECCLCQQHHHALHPLYRAQLYREMDHAIPQLRLKRHFLSS